MFEHDLVVSNAKGMNQQAMPINYSWLLGGGGVIFKSRVTSRYVLSRNYAIKIHWFQYSANHNDVHGVINYVDIIC